MPIRRLLHPVERAQSTVAGGDDFGRTVRDTEILDVSGHGGTLGRLLIDVKRLAWHWPRPLTSSRAGLETTFDRGLCRGTGRRPPRGGHRSPGSPLRYDGGGRGRLHRRSMGSVPVNVAPAVLTESASSIRHCAGYR